MNKLITATLAAAAALSLGSAYAADEANQFDLQRTAVSAKSRTEVRAELVQAQRAGTLIADDAGNTYAQAYPGRYPAAQQAGASRAQVRAELAQAQRSGHLPLADQAF